jgi:hypothetical protein
MQTFMMQISHVIGPASLAVYALNFSRVSFLDTVTLLFGYFLAEKLEPTNLFWVFIATLVASIYYGYGEPHGMAPAKLAKPSAS